MQKSSITQFNSKLNAVLKAETRKDCQFSSYCFSILLEVLERALKQMKEFKGIHIGKEEVLLFTDMIV